MSRLTDTAAQLLSPGAVNLLNRTSFAQGPIADVCPMRFYFGQYPILLRPDTVTHLMFAGTEPGQTQVHFFSPYPEEAVVLKVFYQRPNSLNVYAGPNAPPALMPTLVAGRTDLANLPGLADPHGTWLHNPQARHLSLTLRGTAGWAPNPVNLLRLASVQVTVSLSCTVEEFYGSSVVSNMAALLGIPSSRIKVVSVAPLVSVRRRGAAAAGAAAEGGGGGMPWLPLLRLGGARAAAGASPGVAAVIEILPDPASVVLVGAAAFNASGPVAAPGGGAPAATTAAALAVTMGGVGEQVSSLYASGQMGTLGGFALLSPPTVLAPPVPSADGSVVAPPTTSGPSTGGGGGGGGSGGFSAGTLAAAVVGAVVGTAAVGAMGLLAYKQAALHGRNRVADGGRLAGGGGEKPLSSVPPPALAPPAPLQSPPHVRGRGGLTGGQALPTLKPGSGRVLHENPSAMQHFFGPAPPARLVHARSVRLAPPPKLSASRVRL